MIIIADEWNVAKPINHTLNSLWLSYIRATKSNTKTVLEKEHRTLGDSNSGGEHKKGSAQCYSADYSGGLPQLRPDGATAIDANDEGRLAYDENDGRLMMQNGGSSADDTDYTQVGGDVLDEDDMASNSATQLSTQQAIKAYIDALIAAERFGAWNDKDSTPATLVKDEIYKADVDGFVCAYVSTDDQYVKGYTHTDNPPSVMRQNNGSNASYGASSFTMPVKKDNYVEINSNATPTIWWLPIGTGDLVKQ